MRAAAAGEALLVDTLARLQAVCCHDAVIRTNIKQVAVTYRSRLVRAAALLAPRNPLVRLLALLQRDVAACTRLDGVNRLNGRVAVGDNDETPGDDRCSTGDLRIVAADPP